MDGGGTLLGGFGEALPASWSLEVVEYPPREVLGYDELHSRISARLPGDGPFIIVAESFSGPLAIRIGAEPPPNLVAIVLVATFAEPPVSAALRPFVGRYLFLVPPPAAAIRRYLAGPGASIELLTAGRAAMARVSGEVMAHRLREILTVDVREELRGARVPVLSLRGRQDRLLRVRRSFCEEKASIRCVSIDGPHLLVQASPAEAASVVADFVAEVME